MKRWLATVLVAMSSVLVVDGIAEAKRLGGGSSTGMRRSTPAQQSPAQTPPQQAPAPGGAQNAAPASPAVPGATAATGAAAAAAAAPARRSWMGPIAGLAAGLGLAALASHFGFGEALANFMMIAILAVLAMVVIGFLVRRFAGGQRGMARGGMTPAMAGGAPLQREAANGFGSAGPSAAPAATAMATPSVPAALPDDIDRDGFQRLAKMIFIRLQAANDAGDLDDLRRFTTPELFASIRLDLQERGATAQRTDVVQIDAGILDTAVENGQQVVSVRFTGLIREQADAGAEAFDEVWHLVRPIDGSREWAIAGIQQMAEMR